MRRYTLNSRGMQSVPLPQRAWYYASHTAAFSGAGVVQRILRKATTGGVEPDRKTLRELSRRFRALLRQDLANIEAGYYPRVERAVDWREAWSLARDLPRVMWRRRQNNWRDLEVPNDGFAYPPYYQRTFHWQSDGYFSDDSARRYEASVEFLFGGTASMMRRQIVPPVVRWLRKQKEATAHHFSMLDIGTGTGAAIEEFARADLPFAYHGVDLSKPYLRRAQLRVPSAQFSQMNAEELAFADHSFDVVTSVYMFHELPHNARRKILREMIRVLRPGGLLVIEDSAQYSESAPLTPVLARFSTEFHEPYHAEYLSDALEEVVLEVGANAGVVIGSVEPHLVAKVVTAERLLS